ncbi:beta-glucosidase [Rhodococcus sp. Leaf7]|uniref:glycoside hydrolase family 3 C-terminal domain-containing protein n=1 Tax=unclassified Rhodococcus (in: high G+C Gram-positive bacteria) TaxID=192944 RepID=UPI0007008E0A|nr:MULTISPECIES: glycoside hydrolase family 3 C-terminal domain-containing protein [unclassified Rhodococcus (in: high G+C Gram-positive bacteria)]KQU07046.1 beta-glucosidase [Rhodococcus sp. Leaf7]KQU42564.1 beta-glucosidase [Rhodococcus sp. Leaf247]
MTHPVVSEMTAEEKAHLLSGRDFWSTHSVERLGITSVTMTDGPHGVRLQRRSDESGTPATCFPLAAAVGASWDPAVARAIGAAIAIEARAQGVGIVLGPGVNIKRSPLCGRNFEYYSEDPLLSGVLGAAHVEGQQAEGVGASVKHFAANNQETDRMQISADVDERTLREIYLPAFERVVTESAPATVMAAYNRINGTPASANTWLLTDVLRGEWGFRGAVVSDWGAVADPVASVRAGLDLQMPGTGGRSARLILDALADGSLDETVVDRAAARVLELGRGAAEMDDRDVDFAAHHALARTLASECAVLLTNDGTLPLHQGTRIAVIGEFARTPRFQGSGSSRVAAVDVDEPLACLCELASMRDCDVTFAPGFTLDDAPSTEAATALRAEAVATASAAEVAVIFAGLPDTAESEGFDRSTTLLPEQQSALITAVAAAAPRTVVVLAHGGVVTMEEWHDDVHAVLDVSLAGEAAGGAVADLLFGVANPSGRLAETIPVRLSDTPSYTNFPGEQGHVRYGEGVMVGYRWHETAERPARHPFGHGLSYTTFGVDDLTVTAVGDDSATVTVTVRNTGRLAGSEVVQIYVSTTAGPVRRPVRELRSFTKIRLEPGESHRVEFSLSRRAFAYWDIRRHGWVVAPGDYTVQVCRDAATVLTDQVVTLTGDHTAAALTLQSTVETWTTHPQIGPELLELLAQVPPDRGLPEITPELLRMVGSMPMQKIVDMLGDVLPAPVLDEMMTRTETEA